MIEIYDISKTFNRGTPNQIQALRNINLNIDEGEFVVVVGTNGSGKSTLLNAIAGTFLVDSGTIAVNGKDITGQPEHSRSKRIGRVFQNPFSGTAPNMSIAENLSIAAKRGQRRGFGWALSSNLKAELYEKIRRLNMGLEDRMDNEISGLSGGQRQALTLLMATLIHPEILLLDEHTAALDPKSADQVIRLTKEIVNQEKLTTLMVTHSMHQAANLGNRLIMMDKGEIIRDFRDTDKARLRVNDLLAIFEEVRQRDQLDETAAELLEKVYI